MSAVQQGLPLQSMLVCPSEEKIFNFLIKDCLTDKIAREILKKISNRFAFARFSPGGKEIKITGGRLNIDILELNKINHALRFCAEGGEPLSSRDGLEMTITQQEVSEVTRADEEECQKAEERTREELNKKYANFVYTPSTWDNSSLPYMPGESPGE